MLQDSTMRAAYRKNKNTTKRNISTKTTIF